MSCSRLSTFLTATSIRRVCVAASPRAPGRRRVRGRTRSRPRRVDLGEVGIAAPVAAVEQLQQAGAVGSGLGAEHARGRATPSLGGAQLGGQPLGVGARVGGDVVLLGRLVQRRHGRDRVVEQRHQVRERVAEEAARSGP